MSDTEEICGDLPMPPWRRILYLWRNLKRNVLGRHQCGTHERWTPDRRQIDGFPVDRASAVRVLTESFIVHELPRYVSARDISVLDIGCGSGRLRHVLSEGGLSGRYTGIDTDGRRFTSASPDEPFAVTLIEADATDIELKEMFDIIISVSALEHVPDDMALLKNVERNLKPGGIQIHFVPAGSSLLLYLWHGFRQYNAKYISTRFVQRCHTVIHLGGFPSFLVHALFITIGEIILRIPARRALRPLYGLLNKAAIMSDRLLPFLAPTAVIIQANSKNGID